MAGVFSEGFRGKKIGIPRAFLASGLQAEVAEGFQSALQAAAAAGAEIVDVDLPALEHAVEAYYILATAEASANLSRFDGVRYTRRTESPKDLQDLYCKSRSEGFGFEVKKRILLGTFVLSSGFYDAYYSSAQKVRRLIVNSYNQAFSKVDVVATPTMPTLPPKVGEVFSDPMTMYLQDIYTVALNLAGVPGLSLPGPKVGGLPVGVQLTAPAFDERGLFSAAAAWEAALAG
jgi:aspartyl-tRNA(Asn)/glutamyl-tRNA(Gln) amidotransferase subunit A